MRGSPSDARVWSGEAMNVLLGNIQQNQAYPSRRPSIPLDPELVSRINVTDGRNSGNLGQFSKGAKVQWPLPLRAPEFKEERDRIDQLMGDALRQVQGGEADFGTIKDLQKSIERVHAELKDQIESLTPTDYTQSKRFLNDLGKSARALGDPNAADLVSGKWQPEAATVDQLVASLTKRGLKFAPARAGEESAYSALYQSLRAYDTQTSQLVAGARPR
jgi:hypothetical protein